MWTPDWPLNDNRVYQPSSHDCDQLRHSHIPQLPWVFQQFPAISVGLAHLLHEDGKLKVAQPNEKKKIIYIFNDAVFILPIVCKLPQGYLFSMLDSCEECYGVFPSSGSRLVSATSTSIYLSS